MHFKMKCPSSKAVKDPVRYKVTRKDIYALLAGGKWRVKQRVCTPPAGGYTGRGSTLCPPPGEI